MAFTIQSSVSPVSGFTAPTGRSTQGHLCYAVNQGAYWVFYLSSTQSLNALYSTNNGASWNTPAGSPFTLNQAHNGEGRDFGFVIGNISSIDTLMMHSTYFASSNGLTYASRFTLGTTLSNTTSETLLNTSSQSADDSGAIIIYDSSNFPVGANGFQSGNGASYNATHADSGFSWTSGWTNSAMAGADTNVTSMALAPLASRNLYGISDDGAAIGAFQNLNGLLYTTTWSASASFVNVTQTDTSGWGFCNLSISDLHVVALSNNSNTYIHKRWNGTSWASNTTTPGTLTYGTDSNIALIPDGLGNLYAFIIDSSNNIQYNKFMPGTATTGIWGGWTVLEAARTNTPSYITGVYSAANSQIMLAWTEVNGSNYDIIGSVLNIVAPTLYTLSLPSPDSLNYPCKQVASGWV